MIMAILTGWEIILVLAVVIVLFAARRGFRPEPMRLDVKKALFYFLMTLGAVALGCLLASLVAKTGW